MVQTDQQERKPWKIKNKQPAAQAGSKGTANKRARGLERLLKRTLPDEVRSAKETELAALRVDASKSKRVQREKAFSKMYHKIKFFERQKLERRILQLKKQIEVASDSPASIELERKLLTAEHDLLYVRHYPRHKKYLSLFPAEPVADGGFVQKQIARIRARIVQRSEAGTLNEDGNDSDDGGDPGLESLDTDDFFAEPPAEGLDGDADAEAEPEAKPKRRRDRGDKKQKKPRVSL